LTAIKEVSMILASGMSVTQAVSALLPNIFGFAAGGSKTEAPARRNLA
ncbi:MAG: hypothetical protein F6K34_17400, partial [Okeania sp. SIO4D6]|nr:hypothetical protein [Okeania sp. SIO4D6]